MILGDIETARQQAAVRREKALAPTRALEAAEAELADIDEQISQARAGEAAARREQQQRESEIASALAIYNGVSPELRDECRRIYTAQQRLETREPSGRTMPY